jgi:hypothetical protein
MPPLMNFAFLLSLFLPFIVHCFHFLFISRMEMTHDTMMTMTLCKPPRVCHYPLPWANLPARATAREYFYVFELAFVRQ